MPATAELEDRCRQPAAEAPTSILLVDGDRDTYAALRDMLAEASCGRCVLEWAPTYQAGAKALEQGHHQACLLAERLGDRRGTQLLRRIASDWPEKAAIVLTDRGDRQRDMEAMAAGSAGYLHKAQITGRLLEGAIRYAIHQKAVEAQLRRSHAELDNVFQTIPSILILTAAEGTVLAWNAGAESTLGVRGDQAVGRPLCECPIRWDWDRIASGLADCRQKRSPVGLEQVRFVRTDGKDGFLGITLHPVAREAAVRPDVLFFAADVTQRKLLEAQLTQAQKLEAIGQLAAGIAHEINTPTQYVGDNTRFLRDSFGDVVKLLGMYEKLLSMAATGPVDRELLEQVRAACKEADLEYLREEIPQAIEQSLEGLERVTKIVRAMKEFSHPSLDEKTAVDINRAIESTVTVARNEWKYVAEMQMDLDSQLPPVECLPAEFNQVILNIVTNAAHAIGQVVGDGSEGKGTITIRTRTDGDWAKIRISDTGTGIPEAIRSRIFEPFFTTKQVGQGTGQGLAICRCMVVDKHGGSLEFETEVGKGTTFILRLPIRSQHNARPAGGS